MSRAPPAAQQQRPGANRSERSQSAAARRGGGSQPLPEPRLPAEPQRGAASPPREATYLGELGDLLAHLHVNFLIVSFCRNAARGFRSIASPGLPALVYAGSH